MKDVVVESKLVWWPQWGGCLFSVCWISVLVVHLGSPAFGKFWESQCWLSASVLLLLLTLIWGENGFKKVSLKKNGSLPCAMCMY